MKLLILSFLFISVVDNCNAIDLYEVRILFQKSANSENSCEKLISSTTSYNENNNPTIAAYRACATMMMAKYCVNPYNKLSYFNKGKSLLEKCVSREPKNVEIRFLRFMVQTSTPDFLAYNKAIYTDKKVLLDKYFSIQDAQLKKPILACLLESNYVTSTEKQKLKK
jgi:hypothetical protein